MPAAFRKNSVKRFFYQKAVKGFGIGLHIARLIIEQEFNETLTLKTHPGGSEFIISLPRQEMDKLKLIY